MRRIDPYTPSPYETFSRQLRHPQNPKYQYMIHESPGNASASAPAASGARALAGVAIARRGPCLGAFLGVFGVL